jgi:hypothetical protein
MYAGAVTSLLGILISLTTLSATRNALERQFPQLTASQVNGQANTFVAAWVVGGLVSAGLSIFIARACNSGKGWARTTGTVLFGIATVEGLGSLVVPEAALVKSFWLLIWLLGLAAVVLLWQGSSSAFFTGTRS